MTEQVSKSTTAINKATSETGRLQKVKSSQIEEIEALKIHEAEIKQELNAWKTRYENDITASRRDKDDLKSEIQSLTQTITDLKQESKINAKQAQQQQLISSKLLSPDSLDEYNEEDIKTPESSPPMSPVKTPSRNMELEAETTKGLLGHAHRQISNLRSSLFREKNEKAELQQLLSQAQEDLERAHSQTSRSKASRARPDFNVIYGNRHSLISNNSTSSVDDSDTFQSALEDGITTDAGFETATDGAITEDDNYQTMDEVSDVYHTMDEISDGEETWDWGL